MRYDVPEAMHSLPKAFRCADHRRVRSPEFTLMNPPPFPFLGPNSFNTVQRQLTLTRGPDCTDSESSFDPRLNLLCTWREWTLNLRDIGVTCGGCLFVAFVERHIFVGKNSHFSVVRLSSLWSGVLSPEVSSMRYMCEDRN